MHVQQVLIFLLMFLGHILQENPLKYFFQDPKNLAVCSFSVGHSSHNSLSAWPDDFIFSHNLLFLRHLQNGVVHLCPVNFCTTSQGIILRKLQKNIK